MSFFSSRRKAEPPLEQLPEAPKPPPGRSLVGFETVLGPNCEMEGRLRSNANIRLDGAFSGTLEISGNVLVGETASIEADINAKNISIAGTVRGNVSGKKVQLLRTGRIWGDIHATALTTEEGAFIDGKITMVSPGDSSHVSSDADIEAEEISEAVIVEENDEEAADGENEDSDDK